MIKMYEKSQPNKADFVTIVGAESTNCDMELP
jgi:hypothetical protein